MDLLNDTIEWLGPRWLGTDFAAIASKAVELSDSVRGSDVYGRDRYNREGVQRGCNRKNSTCDVEYL